MNEGEVYFALKGDTEFDPAVITECLGIEPTRVTRKAHPRPKITSWVLSSGKVEGEVVDVYALSTSLIARLAPHANEIKRLMTELELSAVLEVVLRITMDDTKSTPAIGFETETIKFLADIDAFIDVDTYRK